MYKIRISKLEQLEYSIERQVKRGSEWIEQLEKTRSECPPSLVINHIAFKSTIYMTKYKKSKK